MTMWFTKAGSNRITNLETGQALLIQKETDSRGVDSWKILSAHPQFQQPVVLAKNYTVEKDARKALDGFLTELGINPVTIEDGDENDKKEVK